MENVMTNGFTELSVNEMNEIDGGDCGVVEALGVAVAICGFWAGCAVKGFEAGRQLVRDIRD